MSTPPTHEGLESLAATVRAPRAAAVAGIAFSVIFATVVVLFRTSVPAAPGEAGSWLVSGSRRGRVELALALLPFAGIAFLWFVGVIRDHLGAREDKLFATVFLGSGVLFVAMMFLGGAVMITLLGMGEDVSVDAEVWQFGRRLAFVVMNGFALRMAAVFTLSATTLAGRLGAIPRWLQVGGYVTALALLFGVTLVPGAELLFPVWVLFVSVEILLAARRGTGVLGSAADGQVPSGDERRGSS